MHFQTEDVKVKSKISVNKNTFSISVPPAPTSQITVLIIYSDSNK